MVRVLLVTKEMASIVITLEYALLIMAVAIQPLFAMIIQVFMIYIKKTY